MLYPFVRFIAWLFVHIKYRIRVTGRENIPETGGVILCSNHINFFDPIVIAVSIKRHVHFMGKKELFKNPLGRFFLGSIKAFPVERGVADIKSFKAALSILKKGFVMGIFAQGTRLDEADISAAKSGTAMFAVKTGAAVVPVGVSGNYKWFSKVNVEFGKPLYFEEAASKKIKREALDGITDTIVREINEILSRY